MDLTKTPPRSPKDKMLGIVSLERAIDKARAYNQGLLGDYHYDCPHDQPLFEFLGTNAQVFAQLVGELETDDAIASWVQRNYLSKKKLDEIAAFNDERMRWHPQPGTDSEKFFNSERDRLHRPDLHTWFDLLDVDEGRPVPQPALV